MPIVAPLIEALASDDAAYGAANILMLRNPTAIDILDGCAATLPLFAAGSGAPVGFPVAGARGQDARILGLAQYLAPILSN